MDAWQDRSVDVSWYGRFPKFNCFFGPRLWHIEIRHRVKKITQLCSLFGFEILKLKIRRLKLWKPIVLCRMLGRLLPRRTRLGRRHSQAIGIPSSLATFDNQGSEVPRQERTMGILRPMWVLRTVGEGLATIRQLRLWHRQADCGTWTHSRHVFPQDTAQAHAL